MVREDARSRSACSTGLPQRASTYVEPKAVRSKQKPVRTDWCRCDDELVAFEFDQLLCRSTNPTRKATGSKNLASSDPAKDDRN